MGRRKTYSGMVISDKMHKTIVVRVKSLAKHVKYNRITKAVNKFKVHDEKNNAKVGDWVRIEQTRPISKDKFFRLVEVIKRAEARGLEVKEEITEQTTAKEKDKEKEKEIETSK
jgi:small subunit ribosomal protein S17